MHVNYSSDIAKNRNLKSNLTQSYRDAIGRLNLHSIPPCLFNLKHCAANHSSKEMQLLILPRVEVVATQLLDDGHYSQFILYARDCILSRSRFPGRKIIKAILEAILTIPKDESNENSSTLASLYHVLQTIFLNFPICQWRRSYLNLVESPLKFSRITTEASASSGVFEILLNLLNDLIYQSKEGRPVEPVTVRLMPVASSSLADEKSTFINLAWDEKFERIFLVLDALAGLFEQDLAMFATKYAGQQSARIGKSSHRPLICAAIWRSYESVTDINPTIKVIVSVYCDLIAMGYSRARVKVVARYLNLISHVLNMFECNDESIYPSYGNLTIVLMREIHKKLEHSSSSCHHHASVLSFFADAIDNLRSPLIKMLLANEILLKLHNSSSHAVSLSTPVQLIRTKFLHPRVPEGDEKSSASNKVEHEEEASSAKRSRRDEADDEKYLALSQTRRAIKAEITEDCYLKLLLLLSSSINHFYRLSSCYKEVVQQQRSSSQVAQETAKVVLDSTVVKLDIKPQQQPENLLNGRSHIKGHHEDESDDEMFLSAAAKVDMNEEVSHRRMYLVPKKNVHIKLTFETISFYGNEVMQQKKLTNLIKKCHEKYGGKFDEWLKFVESVEFV